MTQVWIALGSNLGDRGRQLSLAVDRLTRVDLPASRLSHIYETSPEHDVDEPAYLNAVLQTESNRDPLDLLRQLQRIEEELGRPRVGDAARSGSRLIDLDLLAVGDVVWPAPNAPNAPGVAGERHGVRPDDGDAPLRPVGVVSEGHAGQATSPGTDGGSLFLPHPRLHLRAFVLVPLCEIDPHWRHPVSGDTAASLLAELEVPAGSVHLYGSFEQEVSGCGPYPWRQLPARGGI